MLARSTPAMAPLVHLFCSMIEAKSAPPVVTPPSVREAPPMRRRLATLFVDIAGSTSLLVRHPPEVVLGVVQGFMTLVTEVASAHAGTVKDFEGDGALLYFASMKNAVRAALAIRRRLADGRCGIACGDGPGIAARMSVTVGDVVVGSVGSSMRRGIALIGPSVNIAARLLKHAPPGAIIASGEVFEELRRDAPQIADEFHQLDAAFVVPGADGMTVATYVVPPLPVVTATSERFSCSPPS
jgi:class 3 adenylate cyclase